MLVIDEGDEQLLDIGEDGARFRIVLKPPYGRRVADLSTSDWQDAVFEVDAAPLRGSDETTFTGEEVALVRQLVQEFKAGKDITFNEDQQFRFSLCRLGYSSAVLVTATLSTEGGPYPEIRFEVREGQRG